MAKNWTFLQDKQCTDSERVFAGSGLDFKPKYFAGFGKTQNCFWWNTVFDRFLGKRDSPANIGTGYVIGKENGIRDRHFRSSGRGIVIEGSANTGSGPPTTTHPTPPHSSFRPCKVFINVPQRPQVLRHFPFQGICSQFPAFFASLHRISSCKSWQTEKHNKKNTFFLVASESE